MTAYSRVSPTYIGDQIVKRIRAAANIPITKGPNFYDFGLEGWLQQGEKSFELKFDQGINTAAWWEYYDVLITGVDNAARGDWAFRGIATKEGGKNGELIEGYYEPAGRTGAVIFVTGPHSQLGRLEEELGKMNVAKPGEKVSKSEDAIRRKISECKQVIERR